MVHLVVMVSLLLPANPGLRCVTTRSPEIVSRERCESRIGGALSSVEADLTEHGLGPFIVMLEGVCANAEVEV